LSADTLNIVLATPECAPSGGGGRPPNDRERKILDLWSERGLNLSNFTSGNVVAFVQLLQGLI
jgi:hypothetical protein